MLKSLFFLVLGMTLTFPATAEIRRPARTTDIARVSELSNLALSPDGKKLLFERSDLSASGRSRDNSLWVLEVGTGKTSRFFESVGDRNAAWSPDGRSVAFLREADGVVQLHIANPNGQDVCVLTKLESGVEELQWSPDGKSIAFTSPLPSEPALEPLPRGVRIFTRADFKSGGRYLDDRTVAQIWAVDIYPSCQNAEPRLLTRAETPATLSFWSTDSKTVFYTTNDTIEAYYGAGRSSLKSVGANDKETRLLRFFTVPGSDDYMANAPKLVRSPDGTRVAYVGGNPEAPSDFAQDDIYVMDIATGEIVNITAGYDREVGGDGFVWKDDDHILAIENNEGNANLIEVKISGRKVRAVWIGERVVSTFQWSASTKRLIALASDFMSLPELYNVHEDGTATRLTTINRAIESELALTRPEVIRYQGSAGHIIHGFLHMPPDFDPSKRYPMIVLAHGGPYSWWSSAYDGDIQAIAASGYLVMYVNPRGSASYGQAFASALANQWPGPEFADIMAGVDYLSSRPYVDGTRLGIAGASAGGILAEWAVAHTGRFKAAVSISSVSDNAAYWFLGDQPDMEDPKKRPWLDPTERRSSPLTHADKISTPTLFMVGTRDFRTPASAGGEMMFRLLKHLRVPTALIEFEDAGHAIYNGVDPHHHGLSVHYLLRWMDHHLKGSPAPEFSVRPAN